MTATLGGYMPLTRQLFTRRIADALASLIGQKHNTAKQVARAYGIDPSTAENLRKGHLSIPTLEKAVQRDGWHLWIALGEAVIGEQYADFLHRVTEAERNEQEIREAERDSVRRMEARARDLGVLLDRSAA